MIVKNAFFRNALVETFNFFLCKSLLRSFCPNYWRLPKPSNVFRVFKNPDCCVWLAAALTESEVVELESCWAWVSLTESAIASVSAEVCCAVLVLELLLASRLLLEAESRLLSEVELLMAFDELLEREANMLSYRVWLSVAETSKLSEFEALNDSMPLLEAESRLLSEVELLMAFDELLEREANILS